MSLNEIAPEPVKLPVGVPFGAPNGTRAVERAIGICSKVQRYTVWPLSLFAVVHLSSVVVAPAVFGVDMGNQMILMGRELYQNPAVEWGLLLSAAGHVISGISLNLLRRYLRYLKYGSSKKNTATDHSVYKNAEEVKDIDEGLGGITSILGLGSRKSITARWLGLSPLSFSGYLLLGLLAGHVFYERVQPLQVYGESGFVDLGFVSKAMATKGPQVSVSLFLLVATGTYHIAAGWNWLLGKFKYHDRIRSYVFISALSSFALIALSKISSEFGGN